MLLRTLCLHASERSHALVRWDGAGTMFASLLLPVQPPSSARSLVEGGEWLRMLLADVCLRDGFFLELTTALASVSSFAGERCFADGQLLLVLAEAVDASVDLAPGSGESVPARLVRQLYTSKTSRFTYLASRITRLQPPKHSSDCLIHWTTQPRPALPVQTQQHGSSWRVVCASCALLRAVTLRYPPTVRVKTGFLRRSFRPQPALASPSSF